ncbi:cryptococcal mannosyltransferase 1-domain-containing protein [Mycena filopes]|nr:cryptococcal mannosyltransferase 1-domain-containing protein [Mycena filopes]
MFHNSAAVLPYWTREIVKLINYLGPDNVFISILESYSTDASPGILRELDKTLQNMGVPRRVLTEDMSVRRLDSMNTLPRRVEYLAALRNRVIEPLVAHGGYGRLLFSNDIFLEADEMVELLDTNGGEYDIACGLDFGPWGGVLRDRLGRMVSTLYPYFATGTDLRAVMADAPVRVFSCWNGIVSIRPDPFLPHALRTDRLATTPQSRALPPSHPLYPHAANITPATAPPLLFRASAPDEPFWSESFLLPYDLRRVYALDKIYVNPRVISAYEWRYYVWFKYVLRHCWAVKWFVERVERGRGVHVAKITAGESGETFQWDGVECHPGWVRPGFTLTKGYRFDA